MRHLVQKVKEYIGKNILSSRGNEDGILMLSMVALLLLLGAAYSSAAFVERKEFNWDLNYALGQRYAQIARASHLYAQVIAYDDTLDFAPLNANHTSTTFLAGAGGGGNIITVEDLINANFLPDNFANTAELSVNKYAVFGIFSFADVVPRGDPNAAVSAFTYINIDPNRRRTGADIAAFRAGAASEGLPRLGMRLQDGFEPSCNSVSASSISWGENQSDCITIPDMDIVTNIPGISASFSIHDVFSPAWETALGDDDLQAIFRYPQPGRPDAQTMNTNIEFAGNNIDEASYIDADDFVVNVELRLNDNQANNPNNALGILNVTNDAVTSTLSGDVNVDRDLTTVDAVVDDNVLIGTAVAPSELNIIVGGLNESSASTLNINDELGIIDLLTDQNADLNINVEGNNDLVVLGTINHTNLSGGPGGFIIQNDRSLQAPTSDIDICNDFLGCQASNNLNLTSGTDGTAAGSAVTTETVQTNAVTAGSMTVDGGGGITVSGPGNNRVEILVDCFGQGCPDAIEDPPDDGPLE